MSLQFTVSPLNPILLLVMRGCLMTGPPVAASRWACVSISLSNEPHRLLTKHSQVQHVQKVLSLDAVTISSDHVGQCCHHHHLSMQVTMVKRTFPGTVTQGLFAPPLSQQRLACLWAIILDTRACQLVDLGCGDGALLQYIQAQVWLHHRTGVPCVRAGRVVLSSSCAHC